MLLNLLKKEKYLFLIEKKEDDNLHDNYALVTVRDTGEGIYSEILPKIFSKFITKSFEGIGLGLYISKYIIEAHGGKILAENNIDGKGVPLSVLVFHYSRVKINKIKEQTFQNSIKDISDTQDLQ